MQLKKTTQQQPKSICIHVQTAWQQLQPAITITVIHNCVLVDSYTHQSNGLKSWITQTKQAVKMGQSVSNHSQITNTVISIKQRFGENTPVSQTSNWCEGRLSQSSNRAKFDYVITC